MDELLSIFMDWYKFFKSYEWLMPILATMAAALYLKRKFTTSLMELKASTAELRGELKQMTNGFSSDMTSIAKKASAQIKDDVTKSLEAIDQKVRLASQRTSESEKELAVVDDTDDNSEQAVLDRWGEMKALWERVREYLDGELDDAAKGKRDKVSRELRSIKKTNYDDVILGLYQYGHLSEEVCDLSLELSGLWKSYRTRKKTVSSAALKKFEVLYNEWFDAE
jgi:hypothetical protein